MLKQPRFVLYKIMDPENSTTADILNLRMSCKYLHKYATEVLQKHFKFKLEKLEQIYFAEKFANILFDMTADISRFHFAAVNFEASNSKYHKFPQMPNLEILKINSASEKKYKPKTFNCIELYINGDCIDSVMTCEFPRARKLDVNGRFTIIMMPECVQMVKFNTNQKISGFFGQLRHLEFGDDFDEEIDDIEAPNLTKLVFGWRFNQNINNFCNKHSKLTEVIYGFNYNPL